MVDYNEPIQQLFMRMDKDLREDPTGPNVKSYMEQYFKEGHQDWKTYVHFNQFKYARNLVNSNDMLELIVLCWLPNQVSPVHNHEEQNCWAGVLQGNIEETHFQFKNTKSSTGSGPLELINTFVHKQGQVGFIHDDIALHVLRPLNNEAGVTLHLYSKPIPQCSIYDPETGQITRRKMGFYTINKQIQQQN